MRVDSAQRRIPALREEVFHAFSNPGHLASWAAPSGTGHLEDLDVRAGGGFRTVRTFLTREGHALVENTVVSTTKILALEAPSRVIWSISSDTDDPALAGTMFLEWTLQAAEGGSTDVTVEAKNTPRGIDADQSAAALTALLHQLAALFEHQPF